MQCELVSFSEQNNFLNLYQKLDVHVLKYAKCIIKCDRGKLYCKIYLESTLGGTYFGE